MPDPALLPLVTTAGVVTLVLLWSRVRSEPSGARLAVEVDMSTLVLFALLYGLLVAAQRVL